MDEPNLKRKTSLMDKTIKEQRKVLIIATFFLVTLFLGSSYALLTNFDTKENAVNVATGNLNMSVGITNTSGTPGTINLNGKLPENDTDGLANATPVVLTLKNTGTMNIMKYEVKLVTDADETKVSTLESQYIKYAISLDNGATYLTPSNLQTSGNIIYTGYNLDVYNSTLNNSKVIYLKVWIDETAGNNALNKTFYGSINVELYQKAELPGSLKMLEAAANRANDGSNCLTTLEEDGITYISGTKECINFNYVWYSGKMWRVTAIYPDGAMKMITDNMITSISFGNGYYYDKTAQTKSSMFYWLNEEFLDTLYNYDTSMIDTSKYWNSSMQSDNNITTKPADDEAMMIPTSISPVGLLNSYEYYKSYQNTTDANGYLNIGYNWWLLSSRETSSTSIWYVSNDGVCGGSESTAAYGSRPSIYLKSGIFLSGNGTSTSPYRIVGDKPVGAENEYINSRLSGEYVKLKSGVNEQLFRIVDIENNKTKIVAMDYADNQATRAFATSTGSTGTIWGSGTTTGENTWYTYLNETYYPNLVLTYGELFDSNLYYLGISNANYKLSVCNNITSGNTKECDKTSQTGTFNIGLLRYGEMFATQQGSGYSSSIGIQLLTRNNTYNLKYVWEVNNDGRGMSQRPTNAYGSRPSVHLKSTVKILSGTGLPNDPYVVGL